MDDGIEMETPNVFVRLAYALLVLFRFIFDGRFATGVMLAWKGEQAPAPKVIDVTPEPKPLPKPEPKVEAPRPPDHASALHLLAILQREGRLVDFLQEDISGAGDADIGAAARLVHDGCSKALRDYLRIEPVRAEGEGASVVVPKGFDASAVRLTGNVTGEPPFTGALRHHGWKVAEVKLPPVPAGQDVTVVAPAEVEL